MQGNIVRKAYKVQLQSAIEEYRKAKVGTLNTLRYL
jgi:hypothetical protein